ncbi:hypothetical protein Gotur_033961 [Gossypium turneri]
MEGRRPLVSPPVKNWGLKISSQYAFPFLACLSSFMVRYSGVLGGTLGNKSNGDDVGLVAQRIRARGYEPQCQRFESLLAHNWPERERPFPLGVGKS